MKKSFIEVVKANKGAIIKRGLVVVGALAGLAIVGALCSDNNETDVMETEPVLDDGTEEKGEGDPQED